ncbi:glycosyltransferase [Pararhizobium haloflavum]|uniref:glycosyltransferase n=1 Tax=Pararhizobium haloflavum TaxID=2037914 RepID=UPI000C1855BB|nr:glycosyltransferase [Pararhizobium haloflavum]
MTPVDTLIIAKDSKYGLTRDGEILARAIEDCGGGTVQIVGLRDRGLFERLLRRRRARRAIHIERAFPRWFSAAQEHILIPNQERFPKRHLGRLKRIDRVLAKTHHAETIFAGLGVETHYLGFTSEDRHDAAVAKDWDAFFHLAGGSTVKGTEDILALWADHPDWPTLHLVQKAALAPREIPANVNLIARYQGDETLRVLQNRVGMHLCPSRSEGWGHHLVEAMSCGALVVTTDAPPMNEHIDGTNGCLVAPCRDAPRHLGTNYFVDKQALAETIRSLIALPKEEKQRYGEAARKTFLATDRAFHSRVRELLG